MKITLAVFLLSLFLIFGFFCLAEADSNSGVNISVNVAETINSYISNGNLIIESNSENPITVFDNQKNSFESFASPGTISLPITSRNEYTIVTGI